MIHVHHKKSYLLLLFFLFFCGTPITVSKAPIEKPVGLTKKKEISESSDKWGYFFEKNGQWIAVLTIGICTILLNLYLSRKNSDNAFSMIKLQIITANTVKVNQEWSVSFKQTLSEFLKLVTVIDGLGSNVKKEKADLLADIEKVIELKYYLELSLDDCITSNKILDDANKIISCLKNQDSDLRSLKTSIISNAKQLLQEKTLTLDNS